MIYIILSNGASIIPLILPGVPQLLLLAIAARSLLGRFVLIHPITLVMVVILIALVVVSIFTGNETKGLFFLKLFLNVTVSAAVAFSMQKKYKNQFGFIYSRALVFMTVIGIFGLSLTLFTPWSISAAIAERSYHTNLLTSWISDGGYNSSLTLFSPFPYRLQSLFDEPGTFGILIVPAFFYSMASSRFSWAAILFVGVFLSESVNAWALCSLIILLKVWRTERLWVQGMLTLFILATMFAIWPTLVSIYQVKSGRNIDYSNVSSFSLRLYEYNYFVKYGLNYLLPFEDANISQKFPNGISVSYIRWYFKAGAFFLVMIFPVVVIFILRLVKKNSRGLEESFSLVLMATILFSGLQRSSFFDHILFLILIFWSLLEGRSVRRQSLAPLTGNARTLS